jgi:sigma-B regulation protein RsbU (phosphoserine phosphatase)
MAYQLLWWLDLRPEAFRRIVIAIEFLIPLPAFFFFGTLDLLGRAGRILSRIVWPIAACLAVATLVVGPRFRILNHAFVLAVLFIFIIVLLQSRAMSSENTLIRWGLLIFIACALYNHFTGIIGHYYHNIEPFGFTFLLVCLGVVAGRRTLIQEQELSTIRKELDIARRIQLSILPSGFPASASFRVAARYLPMTSIAGDFYDFLLADGQQAGILIADVSGHGIPAALIASMVKLAAAGQSVNATQPADLLLGMNGALCGNTQGQFVTAAYVYLNAATSELRYAAAAHSAMLLLRNGKVTSILENGLMLAAFSFATYTTVSYPLQPGDRLLLYTDGILEATNDEGEEFGNDRLAALLQEAANLSNSETADYVIATIQRWAQSQNDDLTVLVCDYKAQVLRTGV